MAKSSIRTRLTLWYTTLLAITFVILGFTAYVLISYTLHREADSALRSIATTLAERKVAESGVFPPDVADIFRRFFGLPPVEPFFEWVDPRENLQNDVSPTKVIPFTALARQNAARGIATFETFSAAGVYPVRVLTWPVINTGRVMGVIRVGASEVNLQKTLSGFMLIMAGLFPLALVLAGGGGWFLAHRALRPVDRMTQTARRIGAGQLNARLDLTGSDDELDRLASTLNSMLSRLEAAFTEMRQFTADASHELQTPLTILRGEMEIALRSPRSDTEYVEVMKSALEEIERISLLIEGLLLLARSDAGVLKMDHTPVDLLMVAEEVIDRLAYLAQKKEVSLTLGQVESLEVSGDTVHLKRLLFNLIDNAIKYTPSGGTVTISMGTEGDFAVLSVKDTGIGVSEEDNQKVFHRFFRSADARSGAQGGSGLGLSIVKSIAEGHGGKVDLLSAAGQGSTFRVFLPKATVT